MRYLAGILFLLVGLSLVCLSVALRVQFGAVVTQANPNFDEYPLLKPFIPDSAPNGVGAQAPDKAAETALFRIYGLGVVGFVNVVGGASILILDINKRRSQQQPKDPRP